MRKKGFIVLMDYTISPKLMDPCFSLTDSAGCVLSGSKQCCYRTLDLIHGEMGLELVAFSSLAVEAHVADM